MVSILALYQGKNVASAKLVSFTVDPDIVRDMAERLVPAPQKPRKTGAGRSTRPGVADRIAECGVGRA